MLLCVAAENALLLNCKGDIILNGKKKNNDYNMIAFQTRIQGSEYNITNKDKLWLQKLHCS